MQPLGLQAKCMTPNPNVLYGMRAMPLLTLRWMRIREWKNSTPVARLAQICSVPVTVKSGTVQMGDREATTLRATTTAWPGL